MSEIPSGAVQPGSIQLSVILPAAGRSARFGASGSDTDSPVQTPGGKLGAIIAGRAVLLHAVSAIASRPEVVQVIVVGPPEDRGDDLQQFKERFAEQLAFQNAVIVPGGAERWASVKVALEHVDPFASHIAVHDAARPLPGPRLLNRLLTAAAGCDAVIPGQPVTATLKRVGPSAMFGAAPDAADLIFGAEPLIGELSGEVAGDDPGAGTVAARPVVGAVDRSDLVEVQTPQIFTVDLLRRAYAQLDDDADAKSSTLDPATITDDAGLVEALGETVHVVTGEPTNLKITTPDDLALAEAILTARGQTSAKQKAIDLFGDDD